MKKHKYSVMVNIDNSVRFWVFQKLVEHGYSQKDHTSKEILFTYVAPIDGSCFTTCEKFKRNSLLKSKTIIDCGNNIKMFLALMCVESKKDGVKCIINESKDTLVEYNLFGNKELPEGYKIATKTEIIKFYKNGEK